MPEQALTIPERKRTIRVEVRARVLALPSEQRWRDEARIADWAHLLPGFASARRVLLYASAFAEEIDTAPLLNEVLRRTGLLILPRVASGRLELCAVRDLARDLVPGCKGIPEPAAHCPAFPPIQVDWALVPGLAFDERGYRVGRGAGHYDRLLPLLDPKAPRWALAHEAQIYDRLPIDSHDEPLTGILTPRRVVFGFTPSQD